MAQGKVMIVDDDKDISKAIKAVRGLDLSNRPWENGYEGSPADCVESHPYMHIRDWWPIRNSFMVLRGNAIVNPANGYLSHFSAGWGQTSYPEGFTNSLVDYNQVRVKEGGVLINDGGPGCSQPVNS